MIIQISIKHQSTCGNYAVSTLSFSIPSRFAGQSKTRFLWMRNAWGTQERASVWTTKFSDWFGYRCFVCALICVLPPFCSHMFAPMGSHMCALTGGLSYVRDTASGSQFPLPHCLGSLSRIMVRTCPSEIQWLHLGWMGEAFDFYRCQVPRKLIILSSNDPGGSGPSI